jgi:hypothetical protein
MKATIWLKVTRHEDGKSTLYLYLRYLKVGKDRRLVYQVEDAYEIRN